ncbi:mucin-17-like isoform X2 [Eriocheir sinensis]|uniref:mucin-17-like isoform X2 n=1 Tax=Eriocheir sinensis TaxID=95602 RepID=UPI0021CA141F|nr:mucin-17-like isoform X2 [Eriocheir sinensis]
MAASEEEAGQSDSKNDDSASHETSKQFSTIHQEIENQLCRPGVSYENRVSAVLSGWEHLAGTVEGDVGQLQPLASFLYRWSLQLILQGEWPGLAQIVKTRLGVTLQRCSRVAILQPLCRTLLPLVSDPWGHTTKTIFSDSEISDEEAVKYISNESWEVVRVRVDTMIESRCEELAYRVLKVCIRCIRLRSEGMGVPLYTDEDHNHFVDLYFVLLYKFQRKAFLDEVKALDVNEGVNLVQRLVAKQDKAKVWKHRLKIADLAIQIFLATTIVKKYNQDFWPVFLEWCGVQEAAAVADDVLVQMIHKYMQLSEASQHIYNMSSILHRKFGNRLASLVTELLIRALTMDMNSLEALKLKQTEGSQKEQQIQLEQQMASGFMDLATVFSNHKSVARECVLTAFSLHPTPERLVLLSSFVGSSPSSPTSSSSQALELPHSVKLSALYSSSPSHASFPVSQSPPPSAPHSSSVPHSSSEVSQPPCSYQSTSLPPSPAPSYIPQSLPSLPSPISHPLPSSPASCQLPTSAPSSYSISSPSPHSPSGLLYLETSDTGTEMGISAMSLQSTSTSDTQDGSPDTSQGSGVVQTTQSTTCLQSTCSNSCSAPSSQNYSQLTDLSTLGNSTVSDPVHNSLNYVSVQNSINADNMEVTSSSEVQVSQNCLQIDEVNAKSRMSPVSDQRGLSCEDQCLTDITIDTGQSHPYSSSDVDSQESQMAIENNAQNKMEDLPLSQTTDMTANDKGLDSGITKMKDDVDSMDKFYKSTENFIEQLSQEPPKKSSQSQLTNLTSEDFLCQNYDVLTQPSQVLDAEVLGMTKELCDDLAVVLSCPRWQVLSWMLDWNELSKICGQYLKDADSAKNMTKELKYLNIDYSQFQNMPSAEITEFTGIEKGYEHFIEHESDSEATDGGDYIARPKTSHSSPAPPAGSNSSDNIIKVPKRGRGRPKKLAHINKLFDSDSDFDASVRLKGSSCYLISMSESEESDIDNKSKTFLKMDPEPSGIVEGKRVTAVSNQDRSKRIRIDAGTGKVRKDRSLLNSLRLFRHEKYGGNPDPVYDDSEFDGLQRSAENFAPPLSSLNLNPRVVLTERDKTAVDQQLQRSMRTATAGERVGPARTAPSSQSRESWRYAGSFVAPNPTSAVRPATSVPLSRSPSVQCYVRRKDGKVLFAPFNRSILSGSRPPNPSGNNNYLKLLSRPTSGYDDSYAKFLLQQNPNLQGKSTGDTLPRKNMTLDASLDYLKKQGTTVTYKSRKAGSALALANAQKTVLNRIMSPENAISAISSRTAIAMPVSNNPPNLPPSDKTNPANLSRVLPKGTTVVRKPKADGAGPSGLSNNSGSGSSSGTRTVVTRPGNFPTVVSRPTSTVSSAVRTGNTVMAVRTSASTIRTTYSRGVVVTGSLGAQESAANRSTTPPSTVSSPSTTGGTTSGTGSSSSSATPTPLVSATVVGSVPTSVPNSRSSPMGTQSGNSAKQQQQQQLLLQQSWDVVQNDNVSGVEVNTTITQMSSSTRGATTCTTTVASPPGDTRAASMLETLLRDRPVPPSPLHTQSTTAITTITAALPSTITSIVGSSSVPLAVSGESQVTNAVVGTLTSTGSTSGNVVIASGSNANSGVIMASGVVGTPTAGNVVVASSGLVGSSGVTVNNSVGEGSSGAVQQVLLPGQIVQVHTSDGTTGIGIVQSSSLDLRLPAGTRVIKSCGGTIRTTAGQQQQVTGVINQTGSRQVNVLHNVKILQNVQNRQIVRTVVVPHPVALQGLNTQTGHLKPQVVSLSQGTSTPTTTAGESGVIQPQVPATTVRAKIPPSTIVQKVLGRSGGLVIRTLRPQTSTQASGDSATFEEGLGAKLQQQQAVDGDKITGTTTTTNVTVARLPQDEGLGERLSHYLKTALVSSTSTQSVGTQTLTTAVKPSAGQLVNQVAMNHLRSGGSAALSLAGSIPGISGTPNTISTSPTPPQQANIPSLPLTPTNAVSSETLEQLREFESVFEKVSNKSGKEGTDGEASVDSYTSTPMSSEESMIAAQLLSMANDNPAVTTSSSYVYSVPTTVYDASGTRLTEGTYITIPSTTQAGTLILVNHSGTGTGLVTVASGVQSQQPPPAASPALSSTSSHSSIASSPSSTSSKSKKPPPKSKTVPPTTPPVVAKPKTPPPPKAPAPKPTVAKPQVEESDETKARIQAILEKYKQDLANTPQPQPAPRNRKNCPPPKNEGKTSTKKKSPVKKVEGGAGNSPAVSEGSIVGCPSPSPSPGPANDNSIGPSSSASSGQPVQYSSQVVVSQGNSNSGNHSAPDEKIKTEGSPEVVATTPQILQGVMVSNVKVEGSNLSSNSTNLAQGIAGGRFVQLIRHCGKVTTITTRQPMNKAKTASQGGPPPNVTIQGRISMNDLMESHIASLLTGGSSALTQSPSVVSKIVQQQQLAGHQAVQQVVVQTSGGQQVLQQVAVQQLPTSSVKQQQQQKPQPKSSVIQQLCIANSEELSGASSQLRQAAVSVGSLPATPPSNIVTTANTNVINTPAVSKGSTNSNPSPSTSTSSIPSPSQTPTGANSNVIHNSTGTISGTVKLPLSSIPSSPLTPQTNAGTSPPTPQPVSASPHAPSPATEPSPTPSSFQMGEESNSSEQSVGDGLACPLPPFLTLKSFIMRSPQQPSPQTQQLQQQKIQQEQKISDKCFSGTGVQQASNSTGPVQESSTSTPSIILNKPPQRGNQSHVQLQISQPLRKPTTVIRSSGGTAGRRLVIGASDPNGRTVGHGTTASPLLVSGAGEVGIASSPLSGSSHEGSPASSHSRIRLATRPQDMRSNSIDSLKSDQSVEEVQIPPSPATLTKQIQSAYMTEAALSPSVSQSQHSGSSYSSPSTTHDLPFTEAPPTSDDSYGGGLTQPGHSSVPPAPGLSVTGVSPEGDTQMGALTSPSGDVYLHHSGTGLGLEGLEAGTLPLVSGMEVRTHSPALSDLVSSGPLLTWSPRSADSMMAQSPSLNDALTANIPLDVNHSEDSLCDSSTGFPGLFSIEGDGVSVSSSTSEDIGNTTAGVSSNQQHTLQQDLESQEQVEVTIDLHPRESEQDHTITSTRSPTQLELPIATLRGITTHGIQSSGSIIISQGVQETPWRFDNTIVTQAKSVIKSEPSNEHHNDKRATDHEEIAGPSNNIQSKLSDGSPVSYQKSKQKRGNSVEVKEQEVEDVRILAEVVAMKDLEKGNKSNIQSKTDGKVDTDTKKSQEGSSRKRGQRSTYLPDKRKLNVISENEVKTEEIPTKNGHEDDDVLPNIKIGNSSCGVGRNKRRSSQRAVAASSNVVSPASVCRTRTKPVKTESNIKQEQGPGLLDTEIKDEKVIKLAKVIKENSDGGVGRTRGGRRRTEMDSIGEVKHLESHDEQKVSGESQREIKQGDDNIDIKFSEGECGEEVRRGGRGARAGKRGDGCALGEEEVQNHIDDESAVPRGNRGRHISGTSDTSSNYSLECAVTPALQDNIPSISGGRRRRRHSRESSASSRDGSPLTIHSHDFPPGGVNTRRSSSRDHAKKKKCSCCVGGEQKKSSSGSGRRVSTRAARGSNSGSLQ